MPWLFSKEGSRQWYRHHLEAANADQWVALAGEGDAESLTLLQNYVRGMRQHGMPLPATVQEFESKFFTDGPPKAKRGPSPKDKGLLHLTIALLVKTVAQEFGFP